jgi:hypothetical protein
MRRLLPLYGVVIVAVALLLAHGEPARGQWMGVVGVGATGGGGGGSAPTIESGFPICWTNQSSGTPAQSHAFTFSVGSGGRYLALATGWYTGGTNPNPYPLTVVGSSGAPTIWTIAPGTVGHDTSDHWTASVWTAYTAGSVSSGVVTVTATGMAGGDVADGVSCLWSFQGANGFGAAVDYHSAETDSGFATNFVDLSTTITATQAHSLIVGAAVAGELCLDGYNITTPFTTLANTTLDGQWASTSNAGAFAFHMNGSTSAPGGYLVGLAQTGTPSGNTPPGSWANTQMARAYTIAMIEVLAP